MYYFSNNNVLGSTWVAWTGEKIRRTKKKGEISLKIIFWLPWINMQLSLSLGIFLSIKEIIWYSDETI